MVELWTVALVFPLLKVAGCNRGSGAPPAQEKLNV